MPLLLPQQLMVQPARSPGQLLGLRSDVLLGRSRRCWLEHLREVPLVAFGGLMVPILAVRVLLAGHWVAGGAGVVIDDVHYERQIIGCWCPLYASGEAPSRAFSGLLLLGAIVEAGIQETAEAVIRGRCSWHEIEEFLQMFLEGAVLLLKAQQFDGCKVIHGPVSNQKHNYKKKSNKTLTAKYTTYLFIVWSSVKYWLCKHGQR